ncbi:MAG TPA: hypothetical protein VKA46_27725 [Gemmataceae bacterium]|nr:hypothetical protein [Gemmataceae bacterium]
MPYLIEYCEEARRHLRGLTAAQRSLVVQSIDEQLVHQPAVPARNRKEMLANCLARWELRVRNLRVFYNVFEEPEPAVAIRAIGIKVGNKVLIEGEEVEL